MEILRLGRISYAEAEERMLDCLEKRISGEIQDTLLLCEHDPVFTLGRRQGAINNILKSGDIPIVQAKRGGDVTYHGPGQLVGYPIVQLKGKRKDLHAYLAFLEQTWIDYLKSHGIQATRDDRNTGVWVDGKKMVAIGIACRRWVTWHGFACNIDLDLSPYGRINPCGLNSSLVTRLSNHWKEHMSLKAIGNDFAKCFSEAWTKWNNPIESHSEYP